LGAVLTSRIRANSTNLIVDLNRATLLDAGTINLLLKTASQAQRRGGKLRVVGARGIALEALEIVGAEKRLHAYDEPADLVAEFGGTDEDAADRSDQSGESARRWPGSRDISTHCLLAAMAEVKPDSPEHADLRAQVIEDNMSFAIRLVRRFRDRGEPMEDLH